MRFALVDLEGAPRDHFESRDAVRDALRDMEADAQGAASEFYVVAYDDEGNRVGEAIRGDEWLQTGTIETGASARTETVPMPSFQTTTQLGVGERNEPPVVPA